MSSQTDIDLLYDAYLNPLARETTAAGGEDASRSPLDPATGLATNAFFQRVLDDAVTSAPTGEVFAVLAIEIDQFAALKAQVDEEDFTQARRFVAHLLKRNIKGGELASEAAEGFFLVLLPETARAAAETTAQGLRRAVNAKPLVMQPSGRRHGNLSASVGIAAWRPEDDVDSVIKRARQRMEDAAKSGGDRVVSQDQGAEVPAAGPMSAAERMVDAELSESPFEIVFYVDPDTMLRTDPPPKRKAVWKP